MKILRTLISWQGILVSVDLMIIMVMCFEAQEIIRVYISIMKLLLNICSAFSKSEKLTN